MEGEEEGLGGASAAAAAAGQRQQIRVVRCPKCEKFLPELPNYSVYVCGGCGATLQAKKNSASENSSEKSGGHVKYLEVLESSPDNKGAASKDTCEVAQEAEAKNGEAKAEERQVLDRMAAMHSESGYGCDDSQIPKEPNALKLEASLRDDSREIREAKYRRIRNEEKGEAKHGVRARDRSPRSVVDTIPMNSYPAEGPSDYHMKSRFRHTNGEQSDTRNLDGLNRVNGLEKDRADLLRMLDELRDQVQKSCEITNKPSGSTPTDKVADASASHNPRLSRLRHGSPQLQRSGSQQSPALNGHVPCIPQSYAPGPTQQDLHGYGEPMTHMGAPSYPLGTYPWRNFDNYFYGQYDPDPLISYHHDGFYHQPACSCLHCYHREFLPVQGPPLGFNNRRAPYIMNNPRVYPVDGPAMFGTHNYNSRVHASMPRNHMRATLSKKPAQTCEPIACGAPFTICYNCYEVLQLPKKSPLPGKDEYKLRCGSCSHALVVKLDGSRLDVSAPSPISHISAGSKSSTNDGQGSNANAASQERVLPLYSFSAASHGSQDLPSNSSEAEKMQGISSSCSISEDENTPARSNSQRDTPGSRDLHPEADVATRVPSLHLRDHFGYSPTEKVVDGSGKGSRSTRSEHEKAVLTESFKQHTVKDVSVVSIMDLSDDEYDDPDYMQDPGDVAQSVDHPRAAKTGDSFFTNLIKKSFKINNGMGNGRAKVFINGYPISDRAVRKAEKIAGPIYPGEYWYDYRAGFWGVMGQSCLGMIPPYIPELNYPMPKKCAAGNTGVFVNGRELHQKDLDLLVGRGLPDSPGRSYRVEMSGKVSDEVSGEELYCLGKLAPTVEKMKRGFGMRVPRIIH
ncbi:protein ENHANCED DISEASE RESISTANCE 4-like [Oryza brachyantha]|uniref:protein ENHANCED DISEASE RESISTANCE 4-like n=1 Tax=Oryza brachyantha TaxID=4533 RepID=UPI001ADCE22D|nr:protein ENHANCED DISEASE RESISTANCE 4-like [Oryza brachyantha]